MKKALYFRNISFAAKLDSEADVSKYGHIQCNPTDYSSNFR